MLRRLATDAQDARSLPMLQESIDRRRRVQRRRCTQADTRKTVTPRKSLSPRPSTLALRAHRPCGTVARGGREKGRALRPRPLRPPIMQKRPDPNPCGRDPGILVFGTCCHEFVAVIGDLLHRRPSSYLIEVESKVLPPGAPAAPVEFEPGDGQFADELSLAPLGEGDDLGVHGRLSITRTATRVSPAQRRPSPRRRSRVPRA